jgi:hypothetical protein
MFYAARTEQAAYGMPERVTVWSFRTRSARDFFTKNGARYDYEMHPRPICYPITAKQARDLAPRDSFGDRYIYEDNAGTVYPYGTPGHDAYTLDYYRQHPATIPPARDVDDLARLDMDLLRQVQSAISGSPSQYAPEALERIAVALAR